MLHNIMNYSKTNILNVLKLKHAATNILTLLTKWEFGV
jgi:hypothetical protein